MQWNYNASIIQMGSFLPVLMRQYFETGSGKKVETPPVSVDVSEVMCKGVWRKKTSINHAFGSEGQGRYLFCWEELQFCSRAWVDRF